MATGKELKVGDRVRFTDVSQQGVEHGWLGTVKANDHPDEDEGAVIRVHWDGQEYDEDKGWFAKRMEKLVAFKAGDLVRVKKGTVARLVWADIDADDAESMQGKEYRVIRYAEDCNTSGDEQYVGCELDCNPEPGGTWWVPVDALEPAKREFQVGDRVRHDNDGFVNHGHVGTIERVAKTYFDIKWDKGAPHPDNHRWSRPHADTIYKLVEGEDEDQDWDPLTEPIHVGDLVEIVKNSEEWKGKRGRVTVADDPRNGSWTIMGLDGKPVGSVSSSKGGRWGRRDSLKLIEKGDGTAPAPKVKKEAPPPPKFAEGDEVRILYTTKELMERGNSIVAAARLSKRVGKIIGTDTTEPKWFVQVESVGDVQWCDTDKLEKLSVA